MSRNKKSNIEENNEEIINDEEQKENKVISKLVSKDSKKSKTQSLSDFLY